VCQEAVGGWGMDGIRDGEVGSGGDGQRETKGGKGRGILTRIREPLIFAIGVVMDSWSRQAREELVARPVALARIVGRGGEGCGGDKDEKRGGEERDFQLS
jgi:hypothetical protein